VLRVLRYRASGFGSPVSGYRFQVKHFGFRVRVSGFGSRVSGFGFRVSGFWYMVSGCGFKARDRVLENNYFTEMCSGSEAGSHLRLIDFVYHA